MKDSYTLDRDQAGLDEGYAKHEEAYDRIYRRCGLTFYKVESDTGLMGGTMAHEYMAPSSAGEDRVARCSGCDYAANVEMAVSRIDRAPSPPSAAVAEVETPGVTTIDGAGAVPRRRRAHDEQGDAGRRRRRQGLARARARRPPPARAQAQQGAQAGDARRHARGDRGRVRREAGLDRAGRDPRGRDRRHRGRRDAARGLLGHGRQPHRLASHRRRGRRATTRRVRRPARGRERRRLPPAAAAC